MRPEFLLKSLSQLFSTTVRARQWLYDHQFLKSEKVSVPVISVGNITVGGTGKTPTVDYLTKALLKEKKRVGIVSRGYKSSNRGPALLDLKSKTLSSAAEEYGDEPTLLAWRNPTVPVVIGRKRVAACRFLLENIRDIDVIIADDAFQHWQLARDLDIVVLDATELHDNYQFFPRGRAREPWQALKRANFVLINKVNLATPEGVAALEKMVLNTRPDWKSQPGRILKFNYEITALNSMKTGQPVHLNTSHSYYLVSGIARPQTFKSLLQKSFNIQVIGEIKFPDHHFYHVRNIEKILFAAKRQGAEKILFTEKDAVKFHKWNHDDFVYTRLDMVPTTPLDFFHDEINKIIV